MGRTWLKKTGAAILSAAMAASLVAGCGSSQNTAAPTASGTLETSGTSGTSGESAASAGTASTESTEGEKVFYYGDTTFNAENDEADVNPHNGYA